MLDAAPMSHPPYFHPAVDAWFNGRFSAPTPAQADAWPAIQSGKHVLIAAPTGSGKTLAAFLAAIDELVREGEQFGLPDETRIVYVSPPLKALSNDINRNLGALLAGIRDKLLELGMRDVDIRTFVRTGDTPQAERNQARRKPPHVVVNYARVAVHSARLGVGPRDVEHDAHSSSSTKSMRSQAASAARICRFRWNGWKRSVGRRVTRVGLSATQQPIDRSRAFSGRQTLSAARMAKPTARSSTVATIRKRDLAIELPDEPLEAMMSNETWGAGLRPPRAAHQATSHDADLREHAAHGRAGSVVSSPSALDKDSRRMRRLQLLPITAAWRKSCASMPNSG